jgi:hypothetical protein
MNITIPLHFYSLHYATLNSQFQEVAFINNNADLHIRHCAETGDIPTHCTPGYWNASEEGKYIEKIEIFLYASATLDLRLHERILT